MKKILMCTCTAFAFFVAAAVAQTAPPSETTNPGSQGTSNSSPSMGTEGAGAQNGSNSGSMGNTSNSNMKGERKMKGCIESQGGQYMLETKKGHDVALTGQDVSAHVGHEVTVHGMWEGSSGNMSNTSSGTGMTSGKSFNVTSVDMISETCNIGKGKSSSSGMSGGNGNSTGTSGTGNAGNGNSGTPGNVPPQ